MNGWGVTTHQRSMHRSVIEAIQFSTLSGGVDFSGGSLGETDPREKGNDPCTSAGILPDMGRRRSGKSPPGESRRATKSPGIVSSCSLMRAQRSLFYCMY